MFNQDAFNAFIIKHKVVQIFETPITLKSGKTSHVYINWRSVSNNAHLLKHCAEFVIEFCCHHSISPDCFYGVPEGATKLGIITQFLWASHPKNPSQSPQLCMGRSTPKLHGNPADKFFIGEPTGKIILLEDVTTTGQSMFNTLDHLLALEKQVIACIGLTNRQSTTNTHSIAAQCQNRHVPYYNLSTAKHILKALLPQTNAATQALIKNEL